MHVRITTTDLQGNSRGIAVQVLAQLFSLTLIQWIVIHPLHSAIQLLNC